MYHLNYGQSNIVDGAYISNLEPSEDFSKGCSSFAVNGGGYCYGETTLDYSIRGKITTGDCPKEGTFIKVYIVGYNTDDSEDTRDTKSIDIYGDRQLVQAIPVSDKPHGIYYVNNFSLSKFFAILPKKWRIFVTHNTGCPLDFDRGFKNHWFAYNRIYLKHD